MGAGGAFSGVLKASSLQAIITDSFSGLTLGILGFASPMGRIIAMLACAAGGLMVFHGNDDFFWVTTTTSGMDTSVAYKTIPIISVLQSLTALLIVFILSLIFVI